MDKDKIRFFAKEAVILVVLLTIVPALMTKIITYAGVDTEYTRDVLVSEILFILAYIITPLTAKIPKFGNLNRWIRFAIIYTFLSFV